MYKTMDIIVKVTKRMRVQFNEVYPNSNEDARRALEEGHYLDVSDEEDLSYGEVLSIEVVDEEEC